LYAVGDVRRSQGRLDEAMGYFERALRIFKLTIGNNHYIMADACYRLAGRLIWVGKSSEVAFSDWSMGFPQLTEAVPYWSKALKSMGASSGVSLRLHVLHS